MGGGHCARGGWARGRCGARVSEFRRRARVCVRVCAARVRAAERLAPQPPLPKGAHPSLQPPLPRAHSLVRWAGRTGRARGLPGNASRNAAPRGRGGQMAPAKNAHDRRAAVVDDRAPGRGVAGRGWEVCGWGGPRSLKRIGESEDRESKSASLPAAGSRAHHRPPSPATLCRQGPPPQHGARGPALFVHTLRRGLPDVAPLSRPHMQ